MITLAESATHVHYVAQFTSLTKLIFSGEFLLFFFKFTQSTLMYIIIDNHNYNIIMHEFELI